MSHLTHHIIPWERVAALGRGASPRACGAVVTFVGVVRPDNDGGRTVVALDYEAYDAMAENQIERLVIEAQHRWVLDAVEIEHRIGRIEVGHIGVAIVVAAKHRADAYAASMFLMDEIKRIVPIWKRTRYDNGTSEWAACVSDMDSVGAVHAHV